MVSNASEKLNYSVKWSEPYRFVFMRNSCFRGKINHMLRIFLVCLIVLLSFLVWSLTGFIGEPKIFAAIALAGGLIMVYPLHWMSTLTPLSVSLTDRRICVGREWINYDDLDYVVFGSIDYKGEIYPTVMFRTRDSVQRIIGLPNASKFIDIRDYLLKKGVSIEE